MRYKIDDSIVERATKCGKDNACLKDAKHSLCPVERLAKASEVLFVCTDGRDPCNLRVPFGQGNVCACPVRIEIFKRYGA